MAEITINATIGQRIFDALPDNSSTNFSVGEFASIVEIDRSVLKLPFTGIPTGSTITAVTLQLYLSANDASNTRTMGIYRSLRAFTTNATWNKYDGTNNWGTAGAANTTTDREATDVGSVSIAFNESVGYKNITLTAASIQEMFVSSFTNNGFIVKMDTENADQHDFNNPAQTYPPKWVITYTPPPSGFFAFL